MQLKRLGPYKIGRRIGKGGMGAVYEAVYDQPGPQHGLRVAIKVLGPQMASAEGFRERFEAEIVSMMQLSHEGIVRIYGKGEQDGVLFYSMELVEGISLEEEISSGRRFNWRETLKIGIQVCRALKHAHDVGVVHRDIKPANLLLTPEGRVKIADFGIARFFHNTQLTSAGGVLGTADYMSPEQADGRQVTEKCDQYSLGGVMYALLAGRPPFIAKTMPEMLQLQRFAEPEPVRRYATETPDQLNRLISQLLAKDPQDRFPNVMVLGRHMSAMEKALSRPLQSPAEKGETKVGENQIDSAANHATAEVRDEATRALDKPVVLPHDTKSEPVATDIFDAATLDQPGDVQQPELDPPVLTSPEPLRTTFTTVDEEKRRQQQHTGGNMWVISAQLALLVTVLVVLVWGGWRLMRPASADELFQEITTKIEQQGDGDLRIVSSQLDKFAERFADDPRNRELDPLRKQWEFQRFERQALSSRSANADTASPIGRVYVEAVRLAQDDSAAALGMLQNLVALYDPLDFTWELQPAEMGIGDNPFGEVDQRWLMLARQKISELRHDLDAQAKAQLPALRERLAAAAALERTRPTRALQMYQAIIHLYGNRPWAREIVAQARARVAELDAQSPE